MVRLKGLLFDLLLGAVLGTALCDVVAPALLTWYNTPGGGDAMCHCSELVRSSVTQLVRWQTLFAGGGSILCGFIGFLLRRGKPPATAVVPR